MNPLMSKIKEVASDYVIIRQNGFCKCPFHSDTWTGVMYIDEWNELAYCPICNKSWTPVLFLADIKKIQTYEAYSIINKPDTVSDEWANPYKEILAQVNLYKKNYVGSPGEAYMLSRWVDAVTADHYDLWYASDGFFKWRVIFPIKNIYGKYVGMTARTIYWEDPKYKNSKNTNIFSKKRLLYWYDPDYEYKSYILCEWQMDVIKLQSLWFSNAVCSSGTAVNRDQLILLKKVVILFDQDDAGKKATERTIEICKSIWVDYAVVNIPEGKDADEFISNGWDIFSILPYEVNFCKSTKENIKDTLATFSLVDEQVIEDSIVSKNWIKVASDPVLHTYLSTITDSKARYFIERELRFRRWWEHKEVDIEQVKLSVPIESIIESYGVSIPQGRMNIACPLPDHKDGTPSFSINKQRNLFKCFWCGKWWSQIDFIKEMEKCDTQTAINKLLTFV